MVKAEDNLNLVHYVLQKHFHKHPNSQDYEDYFQVGCVGLVKAAQNYNPEICEFSTYAVTRIKGEILRYIRDCLNPVKIPRTLKEKMFKFVRLYGKGLTEEEICTILGVDENELIEIKKAYKAKREILWLDAPVPTNKKKKDGEGDFYKLISEETDIEEKAIENVIKYEIRQLLSQILSKRDHQIFCLINEGKTQAEVGSICGISQKQVSKILQKIHREIAPAIKKYFDGDDSEIKKLIEARLKKEKRPTVLIKEHQELQRIVS
ncbi:sigma-70 family RNA polymerase sigma factor [Caldicoprobacter algeriensis]|uniref:sigma-70 family RNA polymerase sigma factor n=1 Tax=Caldicoprobacter algeriensis TaxID=699281 RepID=UPI00207A8FAC|nr:sigma-70 family RNA polymerase sigma factor [Caldicoprobacter algeriensis]MCM8900582.1 sigma-70 family RNA polymerase sigma factor [Caldicoprobacter algeriensis]